MQQFIFQTPIVKQFEYYFLLELWSLWNLEDCLVSWLEMHFCKQISIYGKYPDLSFILFFSCFFFSFAMFWGCIKLNKIFFTLLFCDNLIVYLLLLFFHCHVTRIFVVEGNIIC